MRIAGKPADLEPETMNLYFCQACYRIGIRHGYPPLQTLRIVFDILGG